MIDLEKLFTRKNYTDFKKAVEAREEFEFIHSKPNTYQPHPTTGIYFRINGRKCDNGIWKDNYLYSLDTWRGNGGRGCPFDPIDIGVLTYDEIIVILYEGLGLNPPENKQLNFFDIEMC